MIYKKTDNYELHLGDVLSELKTIPSESIDMIFTSPPYNIDLKKINGKNKEWYDIYKDNREYQEYIEWQVNVLNECYRVLKQDGCLFYNHKERFKDNYYFNPLFILQKCKLKIKQQIIWNRKQSFNYIDRFGDFYESIYFLYKEVSPKIKTNHTILGSVWEINPETNNAHPAPFPLELPLRAIYSIFDNEENKTIMDIYNGSGTTGVASLLLKNKYIGIDISERYLKQTVKRLDNYMSESMRGQKEIDLHKNINGGNSLFDLIDTQ